MSDPWVPDGVCETHRWTSGKGDVIDFVTRVGAIARMMPPVTIDTLKVPQAQGSTFLRARHEERLVTLPVVLPGATPAAARAELRRWAKALDPLRGLGQLQVLNDPAGVPGRVLPCYYSAGLDAYAEDVPTLGLNALGFLAPRPYWLDPTDTTVAVTTPTANITITGDVTSWPVITWTAPPAGAAITRRSSDGVSRTIRIGSTAVPTGRSLVITTDPATRSVMLRVDSTGALSVGLPYLTDTSLLWGLEPGLNQLTVDVAGGLNLVYRNRWLAA